MIDGAVARLEELLEVLRTDALHRLDLAIVTRHALHLGLDLALLLLLALDVDLPAAQPGGQTHVLALLPDGERELLVIDDDLEPLVRGIDQVHAVDLGRVQRVRDEGAGVIGVLHDIDLFSAHLADDRLDARAFHADAGAYGVDITVLGPDGDLGALSGIPHGLLDDHGAVVDLRHLHLEELHEEALVGAGDDDLRALGVVVHLDDDGPDAIALAVALRLRLFFLWQHRLRASEVDDNVAALEPFHQTVDHLTDAFAILLEDVVTLRLADFLEDDLLGGLGRDTAELLELLRRLWDLDVPLFVGGERQRIGLVARDLEVGIGDVIHDLLARVHGEGAALPIESRPQFFLRLEILLGGGGVSILDGLDDDVDFDALLAADLFDRLKDFIAHAWCPFAPALLPWLPI